MDLHKLCCFRSEPQQTSGLFESDRLTGLFRTVVLLEDEPSTLRHSLRRQSQIDQPALDSRQRIGLLLCGVVMNPVIRKVSILVELRLIEPQREVVGRQTFGLIRSGHYIWKEGINARRCNIRKPSDHQAFCRRYDELA